MLSFDFSFIPSMPSTHTNTHIQSVTGLERPEIFGLPAGVQKLQESESGQHFLTVLATIGGAQTLQGKSERISSAEIKRIKKMVIKPGRL